ncbi:MAG: MotA/TolQ/ExbB proton channel family protein [Planctomycetota bacterium]|nr:MotA/TolQ/ExbB proton channel family protein [Planctomycetota bacterium]
MEFSDLLMFAQDAVESVEEGTKMSGQEKLFLILGNIMYVCLALIALWGFFCCVMVWTRVSQKRFRNEEAQGEFLDAINADLQRGDFDSALATADGDPRAMCQLTVLAVENRSLGFEKVKYLIADRFQRDVLADLEFRLSWVNTVIKSAPMVGLLGTVMGMMGAFAKLATMDGVEASVLAQDIQFALITTACGLAIAIPLVLATASINIRIRKMEDVVTAGMNQFFEMFREATNRKIG